MWLVLVITLFLDQITKLLAARRWGAVDNTGIAFGWWPQAPRAVIVLISAVMMLTLWQVLRSAWQRHPLLSGLFWAGALSNFLDRILVGYVVDWIPLPGLNIHNNVADIAMSLALFLLLIQELKAHYAQS